MQAKSRCQLLPSLLVYIFNVDFMAHYQLHQQQQLQQQQQQPQQQQQQHHHQCDGQQQRPHEEIFIEWLREEGLKESNIGRLVAHEFATRKVLRLLREEDAVAIGIEPLGQRRVLLALVASLTSPPQPPPPTISPPHHPSSSLTSLPTTVSCVQRTSQHPAMPGALARRRQHQKPHKSRRARKRHSKINHCVALNGQRRD